MFFFVPGGPDRRIWVTLSAMLTLLQSRAARYESLAGEAHSIHPGVTRWQQDSDGLLFTPREPPMGTDLKFTLRALRQAPWYTATVVGVTAVTLALAITVVAVVDGVVFQPLPYPGADRLVTIEPGFDNFVPPVLSGRLTIFHGTSEVELATWRAAAPGARFTAFSASRWSGLGPGVNENTAGVADVLPDFFDVIGVRPLIGGFTDADFAQQAVTRPVVVMHDTWQRRFAGADDIVGRAIIINPDSGVGLRIVGVMPRGFVFPSTQADISFLAPLITDPKTRTDPTARPLRTVIARLPAGRSADALADRLRPALAVTAARFPPPGPRPTGPTESLWRMRGPYDVLDVVPLETALARQSGARFLGAFAAAMALILIAAANISSLMTSRAWERRRELEVRLALGAPAARIARIWMLEVAILVTAGTVAGALAAAPMLRIVVALLPEEIVLLKPAAIDWRVAAFAALCVVVLSVIVSLAPIRRSLRTRAAVLRGGASERVRTPGRFLVVGGQVAAAFVLTVLGACLVGSILSVYRQTMPIRTDDVQVLEVSLLGEGRTARAGRLLAELERLPGVSGAALVMAQLLVGAGWQAPFSRPPGVPLLLGVDLWAVTGDFYRVLGLSPIEGRLPTEAELRSGAPLLVVSERVARAYWPDGSAIGQTLTYGFDRVPYTVVGVVPEVRWFAWDLDSPMMYGPYAPLSRSSQLTFLVRTDGGRGPGIDEMLRALAATDPRMRPVRAMALDDLFRESVAIRRFQSWLFGGFAAAALVVMGSGIFGLLAMSTARRTKEIGIRCALGATPPVLTRQLVHEQAAAVVAGLVIGGGVALWAVQLVRGYMYELSVADPRIWSAAAGLIVAMALAGAIVPAVRASRTDPLAALRTE
jgi:predicted permease